jgi:hypothetical protein
MYWNFVAIDGVIKNQLIKESQEDYLGKEYFLVFSLLILEALTRWCSWLRHYATNRNVTGSIPNEVTRFFNWPNPSSRTMALKSTQPLPEMSTAICEQII